MQHSRYIGAPCTWDNDANVCEPCLFCSQYEISHICSDEDD
eukprot:SAG11_NODE_33544_length_276_cov_2.039548_1_plen_40_part_10